MDSEIKLVDLTKENLNTVKEAIKIACSMNADDFHLYVKPAFVKGGFVPTKLVHLVTDAPPAKSQMFINFTGLKNLKKTFDFAKQVLGDKGEVEVVERYETPTIAAVTFTEDAVVEEPTSEATATKKKSKKKSEEEISTEEVKESE